MDTKLLEALTSHQRFLNGDSNGERLVWKNQPLDRLDLSQFSLRNADIAYCEFAECKLPVDCFGCNFMRSKGRQSFAGIDISDTTFEQANLDEFDFTGAIWHGKPITKSSGWIIKDGPLWVWCTNAFVQIGCAQRTISDFEYLGETRERLSALSYEDNRLKTDPIFDWWHENKQIIMSFYSRL